MTFYLSIPQPRCPSPQGYLPWHIAMGLGRQMEKAQKPKRSKCCKRRASPLQNIYTVLQGLPATPAWCSTSWGVGRTEPHCCSRWGQHSPLRPSNEVAASSPAPLSNLGNAAEPSPAVSHQVKGAFEQEEQINTLGQTLLPGGMQSSAGQTPGLHQQSTLR